MLDDLIDRETGANRRHIHRILERNLYRIDETRMGRVHDAKEVANVSAGAARSKGSFLSHRGRADTGQRVGCRCRRFRAGACLMTCASRFTTDRVGFEPTIPLPVYRFSRPAPSATRTPVQIEPSIVVAARYRVNATSTRSPSPKSKDLLPAELQHARLHPRHRQRELERRRALVHRGRDAQ